jgi:carbon monoxide dehydrogenase subunit G
MKLEQSFEVDAPLERVWKTLIDVESVAPCLPGAAVTGRNDDGSYNGTFTVKIGPTTASYTGRLEMENVDEGAHTATMQAQGTDKRGQGGAKATIYSRLAPANGRGTRVEVVTDYHITGRLARFGRGGMIEDISERLLREFAKRLQSSLGAQQETVVSAVPEAVAPTIVSERVESEPVASGEPEAPVAPESGPPEAPDAGITPPPPHEPIAPPQPWGTPSEPVEASGPTEPAPTAEPAPAAEPAAGAAAAGAPSEAPAPPPPPSPGPPPLATPPPAPSTAQAAPRPPLEHPPEPSEPMQGLSLVGGIVWSRVKRNPAPAAAAGVAVMLLLARRRRRRR